MRLPMLLIILIFVMIEPISILASKASETKTFRILLNASYLGTYYLPGLQCEAMYDNTFLARTKGFWVEVVK